MNHKTPLADALNKPTWHNPCPHSPTKQNPKVNSFIENTNSYRNNNYQSTTTFAKQYELHPNTLTDTFKATKIIEPLLLFKNINIPPLPTNLVEQKQWIEDLANLGKNAKGGAHKITSKQTAINYRTAITKYKTLLNIKPKTIHKWIVYATNNKSLDCIQNSQGNFLTKPTYNSHKNIPYLTNIILKTSTMCEDTIDHPNECMCTIRKYHWHTQNGIILDRRGHPNTQISNQFTWEVYDNCLRRLTRAKVARPDNIPNDIIKILPTQCHDLIFFIFQQCYKQREIPTY